MKEADWQYVIIWEFHVRAGNEGRFEQIYGPTGEWARFFQSGKGYCGTELNHDLNVARRYVTLDFWTSREAYARFREENLSEYQAIDKRCELLTERETELGTFERISATT